MTAGHITENMRYQIFDVEGGYKMVYVGPEIFFGISEYHRHPITGKYEEEVRIGNYVFYDPKIWEFRVIETLGKDEDELKRQYSKDGWIRFPTSKFSDQMVFQRRSDTDAILESKLTKKSEEKVIFKAKRRRRFRRQRCIECKKLYIETGKRPVKCVHRNKILGI